VRRRRAGAIEVLRRRIGQRGQTRVAAVLETDRLCDMRAGVHLDPHVTELT
jgi:hypothetical protein